VKDSTEPKLITKGFLEKKAFQIPETLCRALQSHNTILTRRKPGPQFMIRSHHRVEPGCRYVYFGFSQWPTTISIQHSFSRHCT
jgi:hypothetical protein